MATNLTAVTGSRPLRHYSIVRSINLPGLTVLYSVTANNLPGHTSTSINGQIIYLATIQRRAASQIIYTTHTRIADSPTCARDQPATTPAHTRSRRQWCDPVGSPQVNDDLYCFTKIILKIIRRRQTTSNSRLNARFYVVKLADARRIKTTHEVCRPLLPAEIGKT